ncbi:MAG: S4 domain-containing protein [Desulfobulbus sp.]|nr:S4 domain-containing protein [Desulfobulbus sp.]
MDTVRIDKWLWAARFFKTRSLASQAVSGGHVTLNGNRVKPSRTVQVGDILLVRRDFLEFTLKVIELSERRGPASAARTLYEESAESVSKRDALEDQRRILRLQGAPPERRPEKHERRKIRRFLKKE